MEELNVRKILSHYWPHMKKYRVSGILVVVFYVFGVIAGGTITPLIYKRIIDTLSQGISRASVAGDLFFLVFLLGFLIFLYNILYRAGDYALSHFQSNVMRELANYSFANLHDHSYKFFTDRFAGSLVTKSKRFIRSFEKIHDRVSLTFLFGIIKILGALVVLFWIVPMGGAFFLLWLTLYCALVYIFVRKKIPLDLAEARADSAVTAQYADTITNALTIKMFTRKKQEYDAFRRVTEREEQRRRSAWYLGNLQNAIQGFLFGVLEFSIIFIGIKLWLAGTISTGTIVLMQLYLISTFDFVWNMGKAITDIAKALADAKEMVDIFENPFEVQDPLQPESCHISQGRIENESPTSLRSGFHALRALLAKLVLGAPPSRELTLGDLQGLLNILPLRTTKQIPS